MGEVYDAGAHYNLGSVQKQRGQLKEAVSSYRRALTINPDFIEVHCNLGNLLRELGQLEEAASSYRNALAIRQDRAEIHCSLGIVLNDLGRLDEAVACFRRAVKISSDFAAAFFNLGNALVALRQFDEAAASYRRLLQIDPNLVVAHNNLGIVLRELEQQDAAAACFRRALEIDPEYLDAMLRLGLLGMEKGDMAAAEQQYRKVLQIKPDDLDARLLIAQVGKAKAGDENLAALEAVEAAVQRNSLTLPNEKLISLNFALGKCFDDLGDFDKAFPHFAEGCRLKRATLEYAADQTTQLFDEIMRVFDAATIKRLQGGGNQSRMPVFVLAMPRSGTTLVEQIVSSHPDIYGAGELPDLLTIAHRNVAGSTTGYPLNIPGLDQAGLAVWCGDYLAKLHKLAPDAQRVTDKMPANFMALGLIRAMFPNAGIIHVRRDPVDTCLSGYMQLFTGDRMNHTFDLVELGRYYLDYVRLMEHWRNVLPAGSFFDVRYEDIVADQETQSRRIIDYCGLDWNDACGDFYKSNRSVRTASVTQVCQPIYTSSVERWRPYEKFLGPLLEVLGKG